MSGTGDAEGDVSGEEAAWRDLIARFDRPVEPSSEPPPWPAREDLTDTASGRSRPERDSAVGRDQGSPPARPPRPGPASLPGLPPTRPVSGPQPPDPGLLRPSGLLGPLSPDPRHGGASAPGGPVPGGSGLSGGAGRPGNPAAPASGAPARPGYRGQVPPGAPPVRGGRHASGSPGDRARIVRRASPVPPPAPPGDNAPDERYVPPPPEPLPKLDPAAKAAWAGLLGGPVYLVVASILGRISDLGALLAIVAFIAGGVTLFLRMSDKPRDDDDDGAVV